MANEGLVYEALRRGLISPEEARTKLGIKTREPNKTAAAIAGVASSPAYLAGMPADLATLATDAGQWIGNRIGDLAGLPPAPEGTTPPWRDALQTVGGNNNRAGMGNVLAATGVADEQNAFRFQPQTFGERVAFGAGVGVNSPAPLTGAMAGVGSEAAGEALKGTPLETPARVVGGVLAAGGTQYGLGRLTPSTAAQTVDEFTSAYTPEQFEAAKVLQADANKMGVSLTGAEALQQVAGQQGRVGSLQYLVERSRGGGPEMERFLQQRPKQVAAASDDALRMVGPDGLVPEQVAGRVQDAAVGAINSATRNVRAQTNPMYARAADTPLTRPQIDFLIGEIDKAAKNAPDKARTMLADLKQRIVTNPTVGAIDAQRQALRDTLENPLLAANNAVDSRTAGAVGSVLDKVRTELEGASNLFATARGTRERLSREQIDPLRQGNIGRIANDDKGVQRIRGDLAVQEQALLDPMTARPQSIARDIGTLMAQDPKAPGDLLRVTLENKRNQATASTQGGANVMGGANFAKAIRGNRQAGENLNAALRATGGEEAVRGFNRVLDVLEATGKRQGANSRTAEMGEIRQDLTQPGFGQVAVRAPGSLGSSVFQAIDQWRYGRNTAEIAKALTSPESVKALQELGRKGVSEARKRQIMVGLMGAGYAQGLQAPDPKERPVRIQVQPNNYNPQTGRTQ